MYTEGDHWIEEYIHNFEQYAKSGECSIEFHALLGVLRGIRNGNITVGDRAYAELASKATISEEHGGVPWEIYHLGGFGLYAPARLGGPNAQWYIEKMDMTKFSLHAMISEHDPMYLTSELLEQVAMVINSGNAIPELNALYGIMNSVRVGLVWGERNGFISKGDPYYGKLLLQAAEKSGNPHIFKEIAECMGENGYFGNETLLGCLPERETAVSRLK